MMLLGFTATSGAYANVANVRLTAKGLTDDAKLVLTQEGGGYAFATACYCISFIISMALALYISPLVGSANEKRMLASPADIDAGPMTESMQKEEAAAAGADLGRAAVEDYTTKSSTSSPRDITPPPAPAATASSTYPPAPPAASTTVVEAEPSYDVYKTKDA